jgi:hypothetical protein
MTSPWSAVFANDYAHAVGLGPRLVRPGDLVVVGDRDRAQPTGAGLGEQDLNRGGAVEGVVGVHVQIDVDHAPA